MPYSIQQRGFSRHYFPPAFLLIGVLFVPPHLCFPSEPQLRVERIDVVRREIFDSSHVDERHFFGSVVNALHVLTREETIRQELLFREGDMVREEIIEESARNLRALGFLGDTRIEIRKTNDSSVVVTVFTQDRWSMDMLPAFKQEGGVQTYRYTVKEDNVLGMGKSLSASYSYQSDRPVPHGMAVAFQDRNVFGTHLRAGLQYRDSWDRTSRAVLFERGYYSDATPWAGGLAAEYGRQRVLLYDEGAPVYEEGGRYEMQRVWYSYSLGSQLMLRPAVGYLRTRSELSDPCVADNLDLGTISISLLDRSFVQREHLNSFSRSEDVPIGFTAALTAGRNFLTHGIPAPAYLAQFGLRQSALISRTSYIGIGLSAQVYWGGSWSEESTLELTCLHYLQLSRFLTLVAHLDVAAGTGWNAHRQMLLGSSTGLRGYAEAAFTGDRLIRYSVEQRVFSDISILFFRIGAAAFLDGGTAWLSGAPVGRQHFSHAVGVGIRIENTKVQGAGLIRIDVAMNLDEKRLGHVTVSSALPFSAFLDLDSITGPWISAGR